jgi:hypothetical protein
MPEDSQPDGRAAPEHTGPVIAEAANGMIRVAFRSNGLIESIHLDPRVKRLPVNDLAEHLVLSLRDAQTELLKQAESILQARQATKNTLNDQMEAIYNDYLRQTAEFQRIGMEIRKHIKE